MLLVIGMLCIPVIASAISWSNDIVNTMSIPFSIEVIKLQQKVDITGNKYYTVFDENTQVYNGNTIFYTIKLVIPSYQNANIYYGVSNLQSGSTIKVKISYTGFSSEYQKMIYVKLTNQEQTLWFNGEDFVSSVLYNTSYFTNNVLYDTVMDVSNAKITATIIGRGSLSDVIFGNSYHVKEQSYYGVKPCSNCSSTNLRGYLVYSDSSYYDLFLSVNYDKLTGIYIVNKNETSNYEGSTVQFSKELYYWIPNGLYCDYTGCNYPTYTLSELPMGTVFSQNGYIARDSDGYFDRYCNIYNIPATTNNYYNVYYEEDGVYYPVNGSESFWSTVPYYYKDNTSSSGFMQYGSTDYIYLNMYYKVGSYTSSTIHKMTSATTIDCDGLEKSYLNTANYILGLLNISYTDIGNIYLTNDNWLLNFGFKTDISDVAMWENLVVTSAIVTLPVAQVPATGSFNYAYLLLVCSVVLCAFCLSKKYK